MITRLLSCELSHHFSPRANMSSSEITTPVSGLPPAAPQPPLSPPRRALLTVTNLSRFSKSAMAILIVSRFLPHEAASEYLALVPGKTLPYFWNVLTSSWLEKDTLLLLVHVVALVILGHHLEPVIGTKDYMKTALVSNACVGIGVFLLVLFLYLCAGGDERVLYVRLSGFQGVLAGLLMHVKLALPEAEVFTFRRLITVRAAHVPAAYVCACFAIGVATRRVLSMYAFPASGAFGTWVYLRYFRILGEGSATVGDGNAEHFSFTSFFPPVLFPLISRPADVVHRLFCGRRERRLAERRMAGAGGATITAGGGGVTTDDAAEAQRRRERGAKALADRLAEKQTAVAAAAATAGGRADHMV